MVLKEVGTARQTVTTASWLTQKSDQVSQKKVAKNLEFPSKLSERKEAVRKESLPLVKHS